MKVALVHDWLTGMRGGEKCLEALCQIFPEAEIFTLLHKRGSVSAEIESKKIDTSFIQRFPLAEKKYQHYLPLFPTAIEQFDLSGFDLVISSSHCVAKGVLTRPETCHICYCHTPMRYAWEMYYIYFDAQKMSWLSRRMVKYFMNYLRTWDEASAQRVDYFIANSRNVQKRIKKHYRQESEVIYPPVEVDSFEVSKNEGDYFLIVSALVPYKRIDLAVLAFNRSGNRLLIIGEGSEKNRLTRLAQKNIEFLPWLKPEELKEHYAHCQALIFPGEEDFGIVPVEAQACGKPVIALGQGGALETVVGVFPEEALTFKNKPTGIFFREQKVDSLLEAVRMFENMEFDPAVIRQNSMRFSSRIFKEKIKAFVGQKIEEHHRVFNL